MLRNKNPNPANPIVKLFPRLAPAVIATKVRIERQRPGGPAVGTSVELGRSCGGTLMRSARTTCNLLGVAPLLWRKRALGSLMAPCHPDQRSGLEPGQSEPCARWP